jgi:hypothetical protein
VHTVGDSTLSQVCSMVCGMYELPVANFQVTETNTYMEFFDLVPLKGWYNTNAEQTKALTTLARTPPFVI